MSVYTGRIILLYFFFFFVFFNSKGFRAPRRVAKCRSCPAAIDDYSAVKNVRRPNNKFPMNVRTTNIIIIVEYILRAGEFGRPRSVFPVVARGCN